MVGLGLYGDTTFGGCPLTLSGFSMEAFFGLWEFLKLSAAFGVMLRGYKNMCNVGTKVFFFHIYIYNRFK